MEIPKAYDKNREDAIYRSWLDAGLFRAEVSGKKPYTIMIPPPNITDKLHMGHALNNTIQDVLIRFKRMQGYSALWLPGTDHAAIATEVIVTKNLEAQGVSKKSLGREGFVQKLWQWNEEYGGRIVNQLKKLGASCDWSRQRFTMDDGLSEAVLTAFVRLYREGKIYRGEKLVNWCTKCGTGISDAEVEHEDRQSQLYHFAYEIVGGGRIEFATTRPETMLGDTAVAVNPDDGRYRGLVGRRAVVPFVGREIPIVADPCVEMDFGTGAVKVTPAHDFDDFGIAERAGLPAVNIFGDDGRVNSVCAEYEGLPAREAREKIVGGMKALGLFVKEETISNAVGVHDRCGTEVEPLLKLQWFLKMDELAKPAMDALESGRLRFNRERFAKIYMHWLKNIRDWNISRKLWWGHRIPAHYCEDGHVTVAVRKPDRCAACGKTGLAQDEDVLDTWFSSALWPFSTLGWPENTPELEYFYPTNALSTAQEIIFFWVVRMVFMGEKFMGRPPFSDVIIHGTVRDEHGKKMSKSVGNGIDPLDVIRDFGADVLRLMLVGSGAIENDMRFHPDRLEPTRNFLNKLWNAARFCMMQGGGEEGDEARERPEDIWILARLDEAVADVTKNLEAHELGLAAAKINEFLWDDFCDWYLEMAKPRLYGKTADSKETAPAARRAIKTALVTACKLLHPFAPFITEDLYQALAGGGPFSGPGSIMVSEWPVPAGSGANGDELRKAVGKIEELREAVRKVRNVRAEKEVPPSKKIHIIIAPEKDAFLEDFLDTIAALCGAGKVEICRGYDAGSDCVSIVAEAGRIYLPTGSLVDAQKELARLSKEKAKIAAEIAKITAKLQNGGFVAKAPAQLVEAEKARLESCEARLRGVREEIGKLQ